MKRFLLNPNESARENLWRAVQAACRVVCVRYKFYGLIGDSRRELLDEMELASYVHFMRIKVNAHGYRRVSDDGKKLSFFDNVLSSVWATSSAVVERYIKKVVNTRANTLNIDAPMTNRKGEYELINTLSFDSRKYYLPRVAENRQPYSKQTPRQRANTIRAEYQEHLLDCEELGVTKMPMDKWLETTGYCEDSDAMWWLKSKEERKEIKRQKKAAEREAKVAEKLHRELEAMREKNRPRLPSGWKFVMCDGMLCITREQL